MGSLWSQYNKRGRLYANEILNGVDKAREELRKNREMWHYQAPVGQTLFRILILPWWDAPDSIETDLITGEILLLCHFLQIKDIDGCLRAPEDSRISEDVDKHLFITLVVLEDKLLSALDNNEIRTGLLKDTVYLTDKSMLDLMEQEHEWVRERRQLLVKRLKKETKELIDGCMVCAKEVV
jgi:hypothetical protein